jgi:hypothetical protein
MKELQEFQHTYFSTDGQRNMYVGTPEAPPF